LLDGFNSKPDPASSEQVSEQVSEISKRELSLLRACSISGRILAYVLDDRLPWSEQQLDRLLEELEDAIDTADRGNWLKHSPGANLWVVVVGAAMCRDTHGRASFILKENCVVSSIKGTESTRYVAARFCYRWLKERRLARSTIIEI
jgi:hypothetical protein